MEKKMNIYTGCILGLENLENLGNLEFRELDLENLANLENACSFRENLENDHYSIPKKNYPQNLKLVTKDVVIVEIPSSQKR